MIDSEQTYSAYQYAQSQGVDPFSEEGRMHMASHMLGDSPSPEDVQYVHALTGSNGQPKDPPILRSFWNQVVGAPKQQEQKEEEPSVFSSEYWFPSDERQAKIVGDYLAQGQYYNHKAEEFASNPLRYIYDLAVGNRKTEDKVKNNPTGPVEEFINMRGLPPPVIGPGALWGGGPGKPHANDNFTGNFTKPNFPKFKPVEFENEAGRENVLDFRKPANENVPGTKVVKELHGETGEPTGVEKLLSPEAAAKIQESMEQLRIHTRVTDASNAWRKWAEEQQAAGKKVNAGHLDDLLGLAGHTDRDIGEMLANVKKGLHPLGKNHPQEVENMKIINEQWPDIVKEGIMKGEPVDPMHYQRLKFLSQYLGLDINAAINNVREGRFPTTNRPALPAPTTHEEFQEGMHNLRNDVADEIAQENRARWKVIEGGNQESRRRLKGQTKSGPTGIVKEDEGVKYDSIAHIHGHPQEEYLLKLMRKEIRSAQKMSDYSLSSDNVKYLKDEHTLAQITARLKDIRKKKPKNEE